MRVRAKLVLPIAILCVGVLGAVVITSRRPTTAPEQAPARTPLVRVQSAEPAAVDFVVNAHGTVAPRREGDLVPQVTGAAVWVSPVLAAGGFFAKGEPLLRIDRADYEVALESARAAVARAESEADRAATALARQKQLAESSVSSASLYDDARNRNRVAIATLREARAKLDLARRDLGRTELVAPYTGRVRQADVDVGQFVTRGGSIGKIYAVDFAEVRLPIPDADLDYLDLPLATGDNDGFAGPAVTLRARFARHEHAWQGHVVRTEGEIDAQSRMVHVVVRVADPYQLEPGPAAAAERPPLAVGLFVSAEIKGRRVDGVVALPRIALREGDAVVVVDEAMQLRRRAVEVLRVEADRAWVREGLGRGDRVVVSPLKTFVEGMTVRIREDAAGPRAEQSAEAPPGVLEASGADSGVRS